MTEQTKNEIMDMVQVYEKRMQEAKLHADSAVSYMVKEYYIGKKNVYEYVIDDLKFLLSGAV